MGKPMPQPLNHLQSRERDGPAGARRDACALSRDILHAANQGGPRSAFLRDVSAMLLDFTRCDAAEIWLSDRGLAYRWRLVRRPAAEEEFAVVQRPAASRPHSGPDARIAAETLIPGDDPLIWIARLVYDEQSPRGADHFTSSGSFWTADAAAPSLISSIRPGDAADAGRPLDSVYRSLALIRFVVDDQHAGLLLLRHMAPNRFTRRRVETLESIVQTIGLAEADRRAQSALRERVKELTCLYGIAQIVEQRGQPLDDQLRQIVALLPPAWQFPQVCAAQITLDGQTFETAGFRDTEHKQRVELTIDGLSRGAVEVVYTGDRPEFVEGAFLREEQSLLEKIGQEIEQLVARHESDAEREGLFEQLRHADRLATLGQLSAGISHELNEPLAGILGFAQLMQRDPALPAAAGADLQKIIDATLHAREVIRKLLLFGRRTPHRREDVDLNQVVREGLFFLESRCARQGIALECELDPSNPTLNADPSQVHQVVVNLAVNAIQAMPEGGRLRVTTRSDAGQVRLCVEDSGVGMSPDVQAQIFDPFFTTKDIGEGTGLGLSVVHGIVTAHGGTIRVESEPLAGARFEVRLPRSPRR